MSDFSKIINWDSFCKSSETFQKNKPFKFGFVEEVFYRDFYERLYQTYPEYNETWAHYQDYSRSSRNLEFGDPSRFVDKDEPTLSKEWNLFFRYLTTDEFIQNFSKFTGLELKKVNRIGFIESHKGDFSLPHIDGYLNSDGSVNFQVTALLYFNKNWLQGDPGGTYICTDEDESTIIFEPYNLDNSLVCFEQSPKSWHGSRYITKDVRRRAISFAIA